MAEYTVTLRAEVVINQKVEADSIVDAVELVMNDPAWKARNLDMQPVKAITCRDMSGWPEAMRNR